MPSIPLSLPLSLYIYVLIHKQENKTTLYIEREMCRHTPVVKAMTMTMICKQRGNSWCKAELSHTSARCALIQGCRTSDNSQGSEPSQCMATSATSSTPPQLPPKQLALTVQHPATTTHPAATPATA